MPDPTCPETGLPMVRAQKPMTITYKGRSATFEMPGWYCEASGQSTHTGEDMKVSDRQLNRLKAEAGGLLLPKEVRNIRKALGLSQRRAGFLIGGGPNAFQKYESGEVLVSHAISSALALLDRDPGGLAVLLEREAKGEAA